MLDRFEKYEQKKEMKLFLQKVKQQENEMESCSFKPDLVTTNAAVAVSQKPRDIQQFVKD